MSINVDSPIVAPAAAPKAGTKKTIWLVVAFVATAVVLLLPTPEGLSVAAHRGLAILVFAVIVWLTEAVSYPVSAFSILAMLTLFMAFAPNPDDPTANLGTSAALKQALGGFSNTAWALVLTALLVLTAVHASTIWNVGLKTGAAQNILADGFVKEAFGQSISWGTWFLAGGPWAIIMCVVLFFVMRHLFRPEVDRLVGGRELAGKQLAEMGPVSGAEWRLIAVTVALLILWSTEGTFHEIDSATATVLAIAFLLLPKVGVFNWKQANSYMDWGTVFVLGVSISLGTVLLKSGAAKWLSDTVLAPVGLADKPIVVAVAIAALFGILLHLGFASGSSLTSVFIPVMIALVGGFQLDTAQQIGFVMVMQFVVNFGFLLPISTPQGLLAFGTGTFTVRDFLRSGIPLTVIGYLLLVLFAGTYWNWIGVL